MTLPTLKNEAIDLNMEKKRMRRKQAIAAAAGGQRRREREARRRGAQPPGFESAPRRHGDFDGGGPGGLNGGAAR